MKKQFAVLILIICSFNAHAQFKLSGKINNFSGQDELQINIPLIYGFYKENSITIPVAKNGMFSISLPIYAKKFANLIFKREFHTLLLIPNKNLSVTLNETKLTTIAGSSLAENKLMEVINLTENPFFMENDTAFAKLGFSQLDSRLIQPYIAMRDKKINLINQSAISLANKALIASEVEYNTYNNMDEFAWSQLKSRTTIDSMIMAIYNKAVIKPEVFPAGPQYYTFARNYLDYMENRAFLKIKQENIKPNEPIPFYDISLDSANALVHKYGKPYWRWIGSKFFFADNITESFTYQQIIGLYNDKDLRQAVALAEAFINFFPQSIYNADIRAKVALLKALKLKNEANADISIFDNYDKVVSVYDVINKFKGKVIYLDVWGTWCGPCKEELNYVPQLKAAFKDKDVVFIYLDMDEDDHDMVWKDFIKVNSLTGIHLRKNKQTIAPLWKELLANSTDKEEYYPQYFIFDKVGRLSVAKALRPSSEEALYQQINRVLNLN